MQKMKQRVSLEYENGVPYLVTRTPINIMIPEVINIQQDQLCQLYLTKREREVLQGVCQAKANKEIADNLNVSIRTVTFHVSALLRKYNVASRHQLSSVFAPPIAPSVQ